MRQPFSHPLSWPLLFVCTAFLFMPEGVEASRKALIVGINRYPNLPEAYQLDSCVNDAKSYESLLLDRFGFRRGDVNLLTDGDASGALIKEELASLTADATPESVRVFIYCGHGTQVPDQSGDERVDHKDEALVPSDAKASLSSFVLDDDLAVALARGQSPQWTVIIDACHSGTVTKDMGSGSGRLKTRFVPYSAFLPTGAKGIERATPDESLVPEDPNTDPAIDKPSILEASGVADAIYDTIALFAACAPSQKAGEEEGHGLFTERLLQGFSSGLLQPGTSTYEHVAQFVGHRIERSEGDVVVTQDPSLDVPELLRPLGFLTNRVPTSSESESTQEYKVSLEVAGGKKVLFEGDRIEAVVTSNRDGYLNVISQGPDGSKFLLFPYDNTQGNRIRAHERVSLPRPAALNLRVSAPFGRERLIAIVTRDPWKPGWSAAQQAPKESPTSAKAVTVEKSDEPPAPYGKAEAEFETKSRGG